MGQRWRRMVLSKATSGQRFQVVFRTLLLGCSRKLGSSKDVEIVSKDCELEVHKVKPAWLESRFVAQVVGFARSTLVNEVKPLVSDFALVSSSFKVSLWVDLQSQALVLKLGSTEELSSEVGFLMIKSNKWLATFLQRY